MPVGVLCTLYVSYAAICEMNDDDDFHHMERSLRMRSVTWRCCHVTSQGGGKWSTFLKSVTSIYLFTLSLSGRYDKE